MTQLQDQLQDLLKQVEKNVDQAIIYGYQSQDLTLEVSNGNITNASSQSETDYALRIIQNGRQGFSYLANPDNLQSAAEQALRSAKYSPQLNMQLPESTTTKLDTTHVNPQHDPNNTDLALEQLQAAMHEMQTRQPNCKLIDGGSSINVTEYNALGTNGMNYQKTQSSFGISLSAQITDQQGNLISAYEGTSAMGQHKPLQVQQLIDELDTQLQTLANPQHAAYQDKNANIIWTGEAYESLFNAIIGNALNGQSYHMEQSPWQPQQKVLTDTLTITDNPHDPLAAMRLMDADGHLTTQQKLVENGVVTKQIYNEETAAKYQQQSTHHSQLNSLQAPPGLGLNKLELTGTTATKQELLDSMQEGYLIKSILGAHTANTQTGDFSVTGTTGWYIKDGEIQHATKPVSIAGNIFTMLNNYTALSQEINREQTTLPNLLTKTSISY